MNFLEAVKLAMTGKRIKRSTWAADEYIGTVDICTNYTWYHPKEKHELYWADGSCYHPLSESILATDWLIAGEEE